MDDDEIEILAREKVHEYYFDYNTVESVLLACSVVVCLSGILFENPRFKDRLDLLWQKEMIAWIILSVIFGSMVYYAAVFVSEIFGWSPRKVIRCYRKCRGQEETLDDIANRFRHSIDNVEMAANPLQSPASEREEELKLKSANSEQKAENQLEHSANILQGYRQLKKENSKLQEQISVLRKKQLANMGKPTKKQFAQTVSASSHSMRRAESSYRAASGVKPTFTELSKVPDGANNMVQMPNPLTASGMVHLPNPSRPLSVAPPLIPKIQKAMSATLSPKILKSPKSPKSLKSRVSFGPLNEEGEEYSPDML